ncbi:alpha/beta fold hydrolase [Microbacterium halophytorum]|uniref:alpha/beta fold hydrolase n=1 Tax=Microbacterium halophytorum TaxID=2067568 RepID=UPI000CFCF208|nr:alpha/beta fold hydrolase [Microbacterium halophytorum]
MTRSAAFVLTALRAADAISPDLAGRLAYRLFFRVRPRMPLRERDRATDAAAHRELLRVRGRDVVTYRWGDGERTVLVIHGWKGRAIQFAPLIRRLVAVGMRVVSFDAPAHGASGGRRPDIRDWMAAAEGLQRRFGPFAAVVGHSVGSIAGLTAARTFAPTPVVATISGAAGPAAMIDQFARTAELSRGARDRLTQLFAARIGETPASVTEQFDSAAHPLPAHTSLLVVHSRDDRGLADDDSVRLHSAHAGRSRILRPTGLGHNRVLTDPDVLDAVVDVVARGAHVPV